VSGIQKILNINLFRIAYVFVFIIPLNIFIIGRGIGVGIQWVFLRYQETDLGSSIILFTRPLEYVVSGTITGRSAFSEMTLFLAILLFIISFILLQPSVSGHLKQPGIFTIAGALLILVADILQSGLLLSGPGGTYFPIGVPFMLLLGYLMYHTDRDEKQSCSPVPVIEGMNQVPQINIQDTKKCQTISGESTLWKVSYITLCILIITMNLGLIIPVLDNGKTGWDFLIYMGAVATQSAGKDPYSLNESYQYSGVSYQYAYPPYTLTLFWLISLFYHFFHSMDFYYIILLIMLLTTALILVKIDKKADYFLLTVLLISAFSSPYWNFLSGNFALLYLVLSALLFFLIIKERFLLSTLVMGIFASFSIFPVLFNGIFLAAKDSFRNRVTYILISLCITSVILLLSYCANPPLFLSFIRIITGSESPLYQISGRDTPTPFSFIIAIANLLNINSPPVIDLALLVYIGIIISFTALYLRKNHDNPLSCYSFIFISIFLLMPRIKPYYFAMMIVPVYLLLKDRSTRTKCIAITIISLYPVLSLLSDLTFLKNLPIIFGDYSQTISLLIFLVFIFMNPDKKGLDGKT
jgi:hypothetical protein